MVRCYRQLSYEERCTIARLREAGRSLRQIAAAVDRPASTISRELKRNTGRKIGYTPEHAGTQAWARRWSGMRLERDDSLREAVLDRLAAGWSPEQVAGRMARDAGHQVISHESIYRFVHAQIARTKDYGWRRYLPRGRWKRGRRINRGGSILTIPHRNPLSLRPVDAADRQTPGHWEADFMLFAAYGQNILVAHERRSRATLVIRPPDRKAEPTAAALAMMLAPLPPPLRQTMTFDNGTEFARHHRLTEQLGVQTFFCDPHSPWQKGGVENAIGRLRRTLPRKTDLDAIASDRIAAVAQAYNNTPRKCLDYLTPIEAISNQPLHFECESTSPRRRE